jgi:hypothetical protein
MKLITFQYRYFNRYVGTVEILILWAVQGKWEAAVSEECCWFVCRVGESG